MERGSNFKVNGKSNENSGKFNEKEEPFSPSLLLEEILNDKKLVSELVCSYSDFR